MDIMNAILDIEKKAQKIADSASELKQSQNELLEKEIAEKEADMQKRLAEQKAVLEQESFAKRREKMEELEEEYSEKLQKLEERYNAGKDEWVDKIINAITGE